MGAVADFVEDAFDAVGDVFEAVGDVVEDVVEFVGDAVEKVGDVVQAVLDDPLPVLLSVAGTFVGIPPYVTSGLITGIRGGDLGDIALSMGTSYLGSSAGAGITNSISSTVSSTFIEAGVNETFAQVASDSITKGLVNGTIAEVRGGSFEDGFAGGFTGGLVSGGVTEVASYVQPDIITLAMDSGLDLNQATSVFNAGVKAVSAGVTSEITGSNDFATSFTNSAIGSGVDVGMRSLTTTIDQQFNTAATGWNNTSDDGEAVDTTITGAGIPNNLVTEVKVSDIGFDTTASTDTTTSTDTTASTSTFDAANVLGDTFNRDTDTGTFVTADTDEIDDGTFVPQGSVTVTQAPSGETTADFEDLITTTGSTSDNNVLNDTSVRVSDDVVDIAESLPTDVVTETVPTGALASVSDLVQPVTEDTNQPTAVVSSAPVSENLLTSTLAKDATAEQPVGGLNAVSTTPQDKMATSLGIKSTDITKPLVATVGNLLKTSLTQKKRPTTTARPAGGLKTASVRPKVTAPPARMNVANLIPIQKAPSVKKPTTVAPAKTLASTANLSPVKNIAGLTSLVKKTG
jgi:hypothetical protein